MAKPAVSRDGFLGLGAFYAAKAHHGHKLEGEKCLLKLFGSADDNPDSLMQQWAERADLLGPDAVGGVVEPRAHEITRRGARYDHASNFLHALLRDLGGKMQ
jgi:hypothetical protein